jgi:hypothetical protein
MIILDGDEDTEPMEFANIWKEYAAEVTPKKCTCGVAAVYGLSYPADKHSEWCDLQKQSITDRWYDR